MVFILLFLLFQVIRVRQYGSTIALSVEHTKRKFNKVVWEKDGTKLKSKKKKFDIDHDLPRSTTLILHDVTEKDSAIYQCILRSKNDVECSDLTSIGKSFLCLNEIKHTLIDCLYVRIFLFFLSIFNVLIIIHILRLFILVLNYCTKPKVKFFSFSFH